MLKLLFSCSVSFDDRVRNMVPLPHSWMEVSRIDLFLPYASLMRLSAFMGMLVMIVCFPLPGYIATIIRKIQQERMKRVIGVVILRSIMTDDSVQSDARVQAVTESKFIDANKMDRLAKRYLSAMRSEEHTSNSSHSGESRMPSSA